MNRSRRVRAAAGAAVLMVGVQGLGLVGAAPAHAAFYTMSRACSATGATFGGVAYAAANVDESPCINQQRTKVTTYATKGALSMLLFNAGGSTYASDRSSYPAAGGSTVALASVRREALPGVPGSGWRVDVVGAYAEAQSYAPDPTCRLRITTRSSPATIVQQVLVNGELVHSDPLGGLPLFSSPPMNLARNVVLHIGHTWRDSHGAHARAVWIEYVGQPWKDIVIAEANSYAACVRSGD
jgi:hypothetical protein